MSDTRTRFRKAVVFTALDFEYEAVRFHLHNVEELPYGGDVYEQGYFTAGEQHWQIIIAEADQGNILTALKAQRIIPYFQPEIALFVGIAGGVKDVKVGDVVVASKIYGYESAKVQKTQYLTRPNVGESSHSLLERARAERRKPDWLRRIELRESEAGATPDVYIGAIAAGEKVMASTQSELFHFLSTSYQDTLAVEMEGRGFLAAAHVNEPVRALVIRGISDLIKNKVQADKQGWRVTAARHASAFAFEVLAKLDTSSQLASENEQATLSLTNVYANEDEEAPMLDITLRNEGSRIALPTEVQIDILDTGIFFDCAAEDEHMRSVIVASAEYTVELGPGSRGKRRSIRFSHQLKPGEVDRFRLAITQRLDDPTIAYVWYYARLAIIYDGQRLESEPLLFSIPPVNRSTIRNTWRTGDKTCVEHNKTTLQRLTLLPGMRSKSIEMVLHTL